MPTPFSRAITQRGLMKSGTQPLKKGDGAGGGGNQTKGTFYFLPRTRRGREKKKTTTTICLSRMAGWLPWHRDSAIPGEIAALLSRSTATLPEKSSGSGWLCPGSQHHPRAAANLRRLGKRHPRCFHKRFLTNVNSPS